MGEGDTGSEGEPREDLGNWVRLTEAGHGGNPGSRPVQSNSSPAGSEPLPQEMFAIIFMISPGYREGAFSGSPRRGTGWAQLGFLQTHRNGGGGGVAELGAPRAALQLFLQVPYQPEAPVSQTQDQTLLQSPGKLGVSSVLWEGKKKKALKIPVP